MEKHALYEYLHIVHKRLSKVDVVILVNAKAKLGHTFFRHAGKYDLCDRKMKSF